MPLETGRSVSIDTLVAYINGMESQFQAVRIPEFYGASGDGADDTGAMQDAIDDAVLNNYTLLIPPGSNYSVGTLQVRTGLRLVSPNRQNQAFNLGTHQRGRFTLRAGTNGHMFEVADGATMFSFENIELDGNGDAQTGALLDGIHHMVTTVEHHAIYKNCMVHDFHKGRALYIEGIGARVEGGFYVDNQFGVRVEGPDCRLTQVWIGNNEEDGLGLGEQRFIMDGGGVYGNGVGVNVYGSYGQLLQGVSIDRNQNQGLYGAAGAEGITLAGCMLSSNSAGGNGVNPHIDWQAPTASNTLRKSGLLVVGSQFLKLDAGFSNKVSACINMGTKYVKGHGNVEIDVTARTGGTFSTDDTHLSPTFLD